MEYCLGRRKIPQKGDFDRNDTMPALRVLDPKDLDNPAMYEPLTIVGILGKPGDVAAIYPFLKSTNVEFWTPHYLFKKHGWSKILPEETNTMGTDTKPLAKK